MIIFNKLRFTHINNVILWGLLIIGIISNKVSFSQSGLCTPDVPFFQVDLTGQPDGLWESDPAVSREGSCCGSAWPDRCIEFEITLDSAAVAINFDIVEGAVPPGALFYQIGCGPLTPVGEPICIDGPGPHELTFCKPGNNKNIYGITSIAAPDVSPDKETSEECTVTIGTTGLAITSITWAEITSGTGIYDAYLSCTAGCDTAVVTPQTGYPAFVDYQICGIPIAGPCYPVAFYCDTIRVYFNPPLDNNITPNPAVICEGSTEGIELIGVLNGGVAPYTIIWTDSIGNIIGSDTNITVYNSGTYTMEVRDANYPTCPSVITDKIVTTEPVPAIEANSYGQVCPALPTLTLNPSTVNAPNVSWTGGTGTFSPSDTILNPTYTLSPAEVTAGSVTITLNSVSNNGCQELSDEVTITVTDPLLVNLSAVSSLCFGETTTITSVVSGGNLPYIYQWTTGDNTADITSQPAGTYTLFVTDNSQTACFAQAMVTIDENPELIVNVPANLSVLCTTNADATATVSGGTAPYTYLWSNGNTSATASLSTGLHTVTVTDNAGCSATETVNVTAANSLLTATIPDPGILCFGTTTTISVDASGGTSPYSYIWDTGATTASINVGSGSYCVTVTDNEGCTFNTCITVIENPDLQLSLVAPTPICIGSTADINSQVTGGTVPYNYFWNTGEIIANVNKPAGTYDLTVTDASGCIINASTSIAETTQLTATLTPTNVSCFGGVDGSITTTTNGSVSPYTYSWSPIPGNNSQLSNIGAGTYNLTITDAIGCDYPFSATVNEPTQITATIYATTNVNCYGGSDGTATTVASGGTAPYSYSWPNGETTATANSLPSGTHTVTASDNNGCTTIAATVITEPDSISTSISGTDITCFGGSDGTANVTATGGTPGYNYQWSNVGTNIDSVSGLTQGNYNVVISDANGCQETEIIIINEPTAVSPTVNILNNIRCFGLTDGATEVTTTGGTLPYTYLWSNGSTDSTATGLGTGITSVIVTDTYGCTGSANNTITEPTALLAISSPDQTIACDLSATLFVNASGGTTPYNYNWNTGETTSTIDSKIPGLYYVTVTDSNGCTAIDTTNIYISNSTLDVTVDAPDHICNNTTTIATANVTGGVGPYTYDWNTGATNITTTGSGQTFCVTITDDIGCKVNACKTVIEDGLLTAIVPDQIICTGASTYVKTEITGGLAPYDFLWNTTETTDSILQPPGTYSVDITDSIGCTTQASGTISEIIPLAIQFINVFNVTCKGIDDGSATATVTGGSGAYNYAWDHSPLDIPFTWDLAAGWYYITVSDSIGCTVKDSIEIIEPATTLALSITSLPSCHNQSTGELTASATGGFPLYDFYWWGLGTGEDDVTQTNEINVNPGNYSLEIIDDGGCSMSQDVIVNTAPLITPFLSETNPITCFQGSDGEVTATSTTGTGPFTYYWIEPNISNNIASNLAEGTYNVVVTDSFACQDTAQITITSPPLLVADSISKIDVSCFGGNDGSSQVYVSGGQPSYTYAWSPNTTDNTDSVSNLSVGTYTVDISDGLGCTTQTTVDISEPLRLTLSSAVNNATCFGTEDGSMEVTPSGGTSPYIYSWNYNAMIEADIAFNVAAGIYQATVTDTNGCVEIITDTIGQPDSLYATFVIESPSCYEHNDGIINVFPIGGTPTYTFSLSGPSVYFKTISPISQVIMKLL